MKKIMILTFLAMMACAGAEPKVNTGLVATQTTEETKVEAEKVEIVNNNDKVPTWALWGLGIGVVSIALIIPSPFKFRGF